MAEYIISSGETSTGLILNYDSMYVYPNGTTDRISVSSGGSIYIYSGATANNTTLNKLGNMYIYSGGMANSTMVNYECYIDVHSGTVNNTTLTNYGTLNVASGGMANNTTLNDHGLIYVWSSGMANSTMVNFIGSMYIQSGGTANGTAVNGNMYVSSGGTAISTTVNNGGFLDVNGGGTANRIVENGGWVLIREGAVADIVPNTISGLILTGNATIHSGTTANNTTVNGNMYVYSGGTANHTTVNRGSMCVYRGGTANNIVENGGYVFIQEGAVADIVPNTISGLILTGNATIHSGTTANSITLNNWVSMCVYSGGTANGTTINSKAILYVCNSGMANSTTVDYGGSIILSSGGTTSDTMVSRGGYMYVLSGGTANNTTVNYGCIILSSGGKLTGRLTVEDDIGFVSASSGAVIDFDISVLAPANTTLLNKCSLIKGMPLYTLTVSGTQENGTYTLAESAAGFFDKVIYVKHAVGVDLGTLSVGKKTTLHGVDYTLNLTGSKLTVTLEGRTMSDTTAPIATDISASTTAMTNQDVTVTAFFTDDIEVISVFYRIGEGEWGDYVDGVVIKENTTVYFKAIDYAGNVSAIESYEVRNIDKEKPTISNIMPNSNGSDSSVTVTALFMDNVELASRQYKTRSTGTWMDYTNGVTVSKNTTVFFKAVDIAGNVTEASYFVSKIEPPDVARPTVSNVKASTKTLTNQPVIVTAEFSDDVEVAFSRYKLNDDEWQDYPEDGVPVTENTTIYFKAIDKSGKESEVVSYEVTNVDMVSPAKPTVSADITTPTKRRVLVSAEFSEDSTIKEYSFDCETWFVYKTAISFTENDTVYFRGTDAAGNVSDIAFYEVTNIDKSLPDNGPDDGWNDYLYDKKNGLNSKIGDFLSTNIADAFFGNVQLDEKGSVNIDGRSNFVGWYEGDFIDAADYAKIELETAAKMVFTIDATDAVKFSICKLNVNSGKNDKVSYSVKALLTTSFSLKKGETSVKADTKGLLLEEGVYYVSVQATNAKKGGSAFYNVGVSESTIFYSKGDNRDDWGDLATAGSGGDVDDAGTISSGTEDILAGWVGFGDSVDYSRIHLDDAAKLSYALGATDATKFTVYKLTQNKKGGWTLKSLQATTLKKPKKTEEYAATTKTLLLDAGDYYISMQSTNAKKGGSADYTVDLNSGLSVFFVDGDDGSNNWVYDKKKDPMFNTDENFVTTEITAGTEEILLDQDGVSVAGWSNFVGYEDAVDYAKITLSADAVLSFSVKAADASKFVICSLTEKKGKYTLKAIQTTTLKKTKGATEYTAITKVLSLAAGDYYISMQSTNAKKGGAAYYNVMLNKAECSGLPDGGIAQAAISDAQDACALAMPETDTLGFSDALSFGQPGVDVLADASASALVELNEKSTWRDLTLA